MSNINQAQPIAFQTQRQIHSLISRQPAYNSKAAVAHCYRFTLVTITTITQGQGLLGGCGTEHLTETQCKGGIGRLCRMLFFNQGVIDCSTTLFNQVTACLDSHIWLICPSLSFSFPPAFEQ